MTKSEINVAGSKSTVLVVEDSGDDAELIRVAFHKAGFEHLFQTVSDVEEARRYLTFRVGTRIVISFRDQISFCLIIRCPEMGLELFAG